MREKIAGILTVITKDFWKVMIMAGMKPKDITKKYSKESLEMLSINRRRKEQIMRILRK